MNDHDLIRLGPSAWRVLMLVLSAPPGSCLSTRRIAPLAGVSPSRVLHIIRRLRCLGLVRYEDRDRGTLRAAVRFIPAKELSQCQSKT